MQKKSKYSHFNDGQLIRLFFSYLSKERGLQLIAVLSLLLISALAEVITIGSLIPFIAALTSPEKIFQNASFSSIWPYFNVQKASDILLPVTGLFILSSVLSGTFRFLMLWVQTKFSYSIAAEIADKIFEKTLYQSYEVHQRRNSSEVISGIIWKSNNIVGIVVAPVLNLISSSILILVIAMFLFFLDSKVTVISFVGLGSIYLLVAKASKSKVAKYSSHINDKQTRIVQVLQEGLGGIRDIIIDGNQGFYVNLHRNADRLLKDSLASINIWSTAPRYLVEALGLIFISSLAFFLIKDGEFENVLPMLGALAIGAQRTLPLLQLAYHAVISIRGGRDALEDVMSLLEQSFDEESLKDSEKLSFTKEVIFEDVWFKYEGEEEYVLKGINLKIPKGRSIGLKGPTGGGKSTFIDLLMGLLPPTKGKILVDGVDIHDGNQRAWQKNVSHVPQDIFLADGTVLDNVTFGSNEEEIDSKRVEELLTSCALSAFIADQKEGVKYRVGERGVLLSGGQRQRVGIARAIYKGRDLLVLDEATSALDSETETRIMSSINALKGKTIVMIAHRVSTLEKCDYIFNVANHEVSIEKISPEMTNV